MALVDEMRSSRALAITLCLTLASPLAHAPLLAQGPDEWDSVLKLQADQKVEIRLDQGQPTVKGTLLAADAGSIAVLSKGARLTLQRDNIRRVRAQKKGTEKFWAIGMATVLAGGGYLLATQFAEARDVSRGKYSNGIGPIVISTGVIVAGMMLGSRSRYRSVYERAQP